MEDKQLIKIGICIPTRDSWKADFGQCLAMMLADFVSHNYENFEVGIKLVNAKGSILPQLRQDSVRECIISGCTHILFLDDDMAFPMALLYTLLGHDKDIIGANCTTKTLPPTTTARDLHNNELISMEKKGIEEVLSVGTGVLLIKTKVFEGMSLPLFEFTYEGDHFIGEDINFCRRAREAGYQIYVDHEISQQVLHIGDFHYHHQLTLKKEKKNGLIITE